MRGTDPQRAAPATGTLRPVTGVPKTSRQVAQGGAPALRLREQRANPGLASSALHQKPGSEILGVLITRVS
ncbi:MAG TPA: hypothetical protein VF756_08365, partial [Thermoanaerobaculia bacterium]